ncbi:MAG: HlyD family secretion protein [Bradyrhizobium sp.]|nr:MAG: HlyD family secretion protein [Bradyrhizobium sp.]
MSQTSPTSRDRSAEPTPLNRGPAGPARVNEPATPPPAAPVAEPPRSDAPAPAPAARRNGSLARFLLMVVVPIAALAFGLMWWLSGGRYVSTDNAYVGAEKSLITPQITGTILSVHVREGEHVEAGAPLFDIDPAAYQTALTLAQGRIAAAKVEFANLQASYVSTQKQIDMGEAAVKLRENDYSRKLSLVNSSAGTRADLDTSEAALVQAQEILEFVRSMQATNVVKLGGGPDASIDSFPDYMQAKAGLDDAERNLRNTHIVAPIAGEATQVDQIEIGRVAPAGQPVFAVVATEGLWVDANPKESDLTYVRAGLPASVTIDAFPGVEWKGNICSIAPGTGAQFSILPAQNASGNWVKVVQRVPLRFCFNPDQKTEGLRAGMSATIDIDTGRSRSLAQLVLGPIDWLKSWFVSPPAAASAS